MRTVVGGGGGGCGRGARGAVLVGGAKRLVEGRVRKFGLSPGNG